MVCCRGFFEIIFVSVAPKAEKCRPPTSFQRKLLRKQFTRGKKRNKTTESNVSDHFNNIFLSNSQLTYVKALQAIAKSAYDF